MNKITQTNSHKGELVIAYNTNVINNTLRQRLFYALYIGPNDDSNGHFICKLSTDQILVTMKYQSVPLPKDLIKAVTNQIHLTTRSLLIVLITTTL